MILRLLAILMMSTSAMAQQERPNIVYIVADDLDQALFDQNRGLRELLTDQGTTFDAHYVSLPLCCPSRTTTLRGQYAHNTGVITNGEGGEGGMYRLLANGLEASTIATWLHDAGYRTALIGKYMNGYPGAAPSANYIPPGWDYFVTPNGGTPYAQFNYSLNVDGTTRSYGSDSWQYLGDVIAGQAERFIARVAAAPKQQPLFLYFAPYSPHLPATPARRHRDLRLGAQAPRTPAYDEADMTDKPAWARDLPPLTPEEIAKMDAGYGSRKASLEGIRDGVARILAALEAAGRLADTYVVFTSDNGFHQGQHRMLSGKDTAYEEDIRVPLVVRGPGIVAGRRVPWLTVNADFAPTFAEWAGVSAPAFVDGRSLVPLLTGNPPAPWRQAVLLESGAPRTSVTMTSNKADATLEPADPFDVQVRTATTTTRPREAPRYAGLRTASGLTYVEYDDGDRELYDNVADPAQLDNIHGLANPELLSVLHIWLSVLRAAQGTALRDAEVVDVTNLPIRLPLSGAARTAVPPP